MANSGTFAGAAVLSLLLALPSAAGSAEEEAMKAIGLIGTWAVHCSRPVSTTNPFQSYSISAGRATRVLQMKEQGLDGVFDMTNVELVGANVLAYRDRRRGVATASAYDIQIEIKDGRMRSVSSVEDGGNVMIKDGRFVASGQPTPVFEKCKVNSARATHGEVR